MEERNRFLRNMFLACKLFVGVYHIFMRVAACVRSCHTHLNFIAMCCSVLHYVAVCCSVLTAVCKRVITNNFNMPCSELLCVAACCSMYKKKLWYHYQTNPGVLQCVTVSSSVLQGVAACCSVLQHVAA